MRPSTAGGQPASAATPHRTDSAAHCASANRPLMSCVESTGRTSGCFCSAPMQPNADVVEPSRPTSVLLQPRVHPCRVRCGGRWLPACLGQSSCFMDRYFTSSLCLNDIRHQCRTHRSRGNTRRFCASDVLFADPDQRRCLLRRLASSARCVWILGRDRISFENCDSDTPVCRAIGRLQC